MEKCFRCGSENLDFGLIATEGVILSDHHITICYESANKKLFRAKTPLDANVCLDCGHVEMVIDRKHLKKRIKKIDD